MSESSPMSSAPDLQKISNSSRCNMFVGGHSLHPLTYDIPILFVGLLTIWTVWKAEAKTTGGTQYSPRCQRDYQVKPLTGLMVGHWVPQPRPRLPRVEIHFPPDMMLPSPALTENTPIQGRVNGILPCFSWTKTTVA